MPYGIPDEQWESARTEMRSLLVSVARNRGVIPYSKLVGQLEAVDFEPNEYGFHQMLDEISRGEDESGRGLLTVIVVHKDGDMRPGPGFFELAKARGRDVTSVDVTWLAELDKVWAYWRDH